MRRRSEINRKNKGVPKIFHYAGTQTFADIRKAELTSKRVKFLDMYGSQVAIGIVMSTDPTKIVMGKPIGQDFCEVAVLLANKPDSPLFIKDHNSKTMKDAIGRHILWFLEYVYLFGASS
ncbi:hypothetical protein Taro_021849 [Colocasia esculenta]|uniref:Transposase Tnp1/En/Spm-like domain-containing protein n=1 Tax=Colocasia esculenta TaxID=4460 RepID=A0A843V3L0_COLES|nr:hypothetical protein [Colocasia esculenta]